MVASNEVEGVAGASVVDIVLSMFAPDEVWIICCDFDDIVSE